MTDQTLRSPRPRMLVVTGFVFALAFSPVHAACSASNLQVAQAEATASPLPQATPLVSSCGKGQLDPLVSSFGSGPIARIIGNLLSRIADTFSSSVCSQAQGAVQNAVNTPLNKVYALDNSAQNSITNSINKATALPLGNQNTLYPANPANQAITQANNKLMNTLNNNAKVLAQ